MNFREEHKIVLTMLSEGNITIRDANALLVAIEEFTVMVYIDKPLIRKGRPESAEYFVN